MTPSPDLLVRARRGDASALPELLDFITFAACEIARLQITVERVKVTMRDQVLSESRARMAAKVRGSRARRMLAPPGVSL